ncbi:MAG TPA: hypothetical protein VIJ21_09725 [Solirubrobacterales bacterium]
MPPDQEKPDNLADGAGRPEAGAKAPPSELEAAALPLTPRSRHLLTLEFGDRRDFDDPRLEWRRLFAELPPARSRRSRFRRGEMKISVGTQWWPASLSGRRG